MDHALARAALEWLVELGADEAIAEAPLDRTAPPAPEPTLAPAAGPVAAPVAGPVAAPRPERAPERAPAPPPAAPRAPAGADAAEAAAAGAADLAALRAAMEAFPSELKAGAQRFVFADGTAGAPLMVVGEAPGRDEDRQGKPFVGAAGQLLDRMLLAIGRDRAAADPARAAYIANVLPWRPPGNRAPTDAEVAAWRPFLLRHVALARPRALLLCGNTPARALLGRGGITTLRGRWQEAAGVPAMPTFHPSFILHIPDAEAARKKQARAQVWDDLQAVRARLDGAAPDGPPRDGTRPDGA